MNPRNRTKYTCTHPPFKDQEVTPIAKGCAPGWIKVITQKHEEHDVPLQWLKPAPRQARQKRASLRE